MEWSGINIMIPHSADLLTRIRGGDIIAFFKRLCSRGLHDLIHECIF